MLNFKDIFKSKFLSNTTDFSIVDTLLMLGIAIIIGLIIYVTYKLTFGGIMYSRTFNISLVGLTVISTFIIMAVTSNIVLSLGMVGALSIVRFRTAIKDPMDLVFLFWAIAAGIVIGAGLIFMAIVGSIIIAALLFIFKSKLTFDMPYLLIINCENKVNESSCVDIIRKHFNKYRLKSKIVSSTKGTEMIYEIRNRGEDTEFINEISALEGVHSASYVSYNGEFLD